MRVSSILEQIVEQYDGKVRVVFKHFVVHPDTATVAHKAACAAAEQQKFTDFSKVFWEKGFSQYVATRDPATMGRKAIDKMATEIGLDMDKFAADIESAACVERLKRDIKELSKFGVNATPSFFINGRFTMFAGPDQFKKLIDKELVRVEKSGVPAGQYYEKVVMGEGLKQFRSKAEAQGG